MQTPSRTLTSRGVLALVHSRSSGLFAFVYPLAYLVQHTLIQYERLAFVGESHGKVHRVRNNKSIAWGLESYLIFFKLLGGAQALTHLATATLSFHHSPGAGSNPRGVEAIRSPLHPTFRDRMFQLPHRTLDSPHICA